MQGLAQNYRNLFWDIYQFAMWSVKDVEFGECFAGRWDIFSSFFSLICWETDMFAGAFVLF